MSKRAMMAEVRLDGRTILGMSAGWKVIPIADQPMTLRLVICIPHLEIREGVHVNLTRLRYTGHRSSRKRYDPKYKHSFKPQYDPLEGVQVMSEPTVWRNEEVVKTPPWLDGDRLVLELELAPEHQPIEISGAVHEGIERIPFAFYLQYREGDVFVEDDYTGEKWSMLKSIPF